MHHARQVAQRRLDDQVIMIGHQAINMHDHAELFVGLPETLEKKIPVIVGEKYRLSLVASGKYVIKSARIVDS
jgi:predicted thioesterase